MLFDMVETVKRTLFDSKASVTITFFDDPATYRVRVDVRPSLARGVETTF